MEQRIRLSSEQSNPLVNNDIGCSHPSATLALLSTRIPWSFNMSFAAYQTNVCPKVCRDRGATFWESPGPGKSAVTGPAASQHSKLRLHCNDASYNGKKIRTYRNIMRAHASSATSLWSMIMFLFYLGIQFPMPLSGKLLGLSSRGFLHRFSSTQSYLEIEWCSAAWNAACGSCVLRAGTWHLRRCDDLSRGLSSPRCLEIDHMKCDEKWRAAMKRSVRLTRSVS
jgi:hypothetical protein